MTNKWVYDKHYAQRKQEWDKLFLNIFKEYNEKNKEKDDHE